MPPLSTTDLEAKAKIIRLLILDVDGVLTNGTIYYSNQGSELKGFHIHDGVGMKLLKKSGVQIAIISAKKSPAAAKRMEDLQIEYVYFGYEDKIPAYLELKEKLNLQDEQIAYMGDDLPDLPILRRVGLAFTVHKAPSIIQQHTHYVTRNKPGKGAVREVCELIMQAQNRYETMIESYLSK